MKKREEGINGESSKGLIWKGACDATENIHHGPL
jgi:hypothetical protein